jgi:glutamate dehydrogenase
VLAHFAPRRHTYLVSTLPVHWVDALQAQLRQVGASDVVLGWRETFLACLPPGYVEATAPADAASDLVEMSKLATSPPLGRVTGPGQLVLRRCQPGAIGDFRLRRTGRERVELSTLLPVLESFGLVVLEAVPWHFRLGGESGDAHVDDIGLRVDPPSSGTTSFGQFNVADGGDRLIDALLAVLEGRAKISALNRLVVTAGLDWWAVNLLSAYHCLRVLQGGADAEPRADAIVKALVAFPPIASAAVSLFSARLDPDATCTELEAQHNLDVALSDVPDLASHTALADLQAMIEGTTRSNWAKRAPTIALKTSWHWPLFGTFVWSPRFAGIHLRFGPVARGGIRWSDRWAAMGTEVTELARAQVKKNSIIIPTGAKGGFALFKPQAGRNEGQEAYSAFINGLLDITDNIVAGKIVHPPGIVCRDGDDPYLVVAPDKGTAHFSDIANEISVARGYWLGDAFASGGRHGFDHKVLAITAKGAWNAVRRHFRAVGIDPQTEPVRVAGVGDMSGDVFGNGMLQSERICLVAAFDHRHIFIDPNPNPQESFSERLRLSQLERSSWADFDLRRASAGAGVYARQDTNVDLSAEARALLRLGNGPLSPTEVVKAILAAPVDLLYFGGIGTFVKGVGENDADIGDHANDDVRISADQLRARVICEGANLAMTQAARASYARRGGRVNADFVDNAAGVALSDREVNLKILLDLALTGGLLDTKGREDALSEAQGDAVKAVLAQCDEGIVALERAATASVSELAAYEALLEDLAAPWKDGGSGHAAAHGRVVTDHERGVLDRVVEVLPGAEELARREVAGAGLSRPELAVLVAYARSELARSIAASPLATDKATRPLALRYFPAAMRQDFGHLVLAHPLHKQLVSSELANEVVAWMGGAWAHEASAETGRPLWEVAEAYWAARSVLEAEEVLKEISHLALSLTPEAEAALRDVASRAIGRLARFYLSRQGSLAAGELYAADLPAARALAGAAQASAPRADLESQGVPAPLAERAARLAEGAHVGLLAEVARRAGASLDAAREAVSSMAAALDLAPVQEALVPGPRAGRWERAQRHLLLDDLARVMAEAAKSALLAFPTQPPGDAARRWLDTRAPALGRAQALASQLTAHHSDAGTSNGRARQLALSALTVRALAQAVRAR